MKQRITIQDLEQLSPGQQNRLKELWAPELYDVAAAYICKDVSINAIDHFEFVVGSIGLYGTHIFLTDLKAIDDIEEEEETMADDKESIHSPLYDEGDFDDNNDYNDDEDYEDDEDDEYYDEFDENDLEANYIRPDTFSKEDCLPLLNIGQMIDILQKNNFGKTSFQLHVSTYDLMCEIGNENPSWDTYEEEYKTGELCDVLWESVKELL
jgi:hypothetical protein